MSPQFRQRMRLVWWLPGVLFGTTLCTVLVLSIYLPALLGHGLSWNRLGLVIYLLVLIGLSWQLRTRVRRSILYPIPEPRARSERAGRVVIGGVLLALLVFGGGGISSWSCPHGNHFRVSFVGISRSNMGGPCRNEALIVRSWRIGGEWYVWVAE